ncbi:MAG: DUF1365 family protein, partial [Verrucomicrobiota bacterium]
HRFQRLEDGWKAETPEKKTFHVSPFNDMEGAYEFLVRRNANDIEVQVNLFKKGKPFFLSTIAGTARPITTASLAGTMMRFPVRAALTMPRILMEAAKLHYGKRLKVFKKPDPQSAMTFRRPGNRLSDRPLAGLVFKQFRLMKEDALYVELPNGKRHRFGDPDAGNPGLIQVRDMRFFRDTAFGGSVGFGESFVEGRWDTPDLSRVMNVLSRNQSHFDPEKGWISAAVRSVNTFRHAGRRGHRDNCRKNIQEHYDLGNDFYELFLDPTMTYSSALFADGSETLEQAQKKKIHRLIERLQIMPDDHVLEIGSGWGSSAIELSRRTGCQVTSITLSKEQCRFARERVREAGLEDRVEILIRDYRDVEGDFDHILSIEMLEAVGHEYYDAYFKTLERLLRPGGRVAIQVISIPDDRYEAYRRRCDWIQKHIFPGGCLPSLAALRASWRRTSALKLEEDFTMGSHYGRTLRAWRDRFLAHKDEVKRLGFDDAFIRKWIYYFCYCEAGFDTDMIDVRQLILTR